MNPWVARNLIYRPVQALRGEQVWKFRDEVREFHRLGSREMADVQWKRVLAALHRVYEQNPYYRSLFDECGLHPSQVETPEDFKRVPLLTKKAVQDNFEALSSGAGRRVDHRQTSGSTGVPLSFVKDREALAYMNGVMHEVYSWHGINYPGDRSCRIWAIPQSLKKKVFIWTVDTLQNRIRLNSFDVSDASAERFFHKACKFRPKFLFGVPSYTSEFATRVQRLGLDPRDIGVETLIMGGETLYPMQKELVGSAFGAAVVNEYGTTENGLISFSCARDRIHVMNQNLYVEVIDPETGADVPPGQPGEVVVTELYGRVMPFIRYRVGDTAVPSSELCPCGVETPLFERLEGRLEDMIETPDGRKVAGGMLYYTLRKGVKRFKAYQRAVDRLEVLIIKGPDFTDSVLEDVREQCRHFLGDEMKIEFRFVDSIPPDRSGKLRFFVPEKDPEYTKRP